MIFAGINRAQLSFSENIQCLMHHEFIEFTRHTGVKLNVISFQDSFDYFLPTRHTPSFWYLISSSIGFFFWATQLQKNQDNLLILFFDFLGFVKEKQQ